MLKEQDIRDCLERAKAQLPLYYWKTHCFRRIPAFCYFVLSS